MCKFHKELAIDIATDPVTKKINPVAYSVSLVALAKYWIDRYMPDIPDCDGYSPYAMMSPKAVAALDKSGLEQDVALIGAFRDSNIGHVRTAILNLIEEQQLTLESLNLRKDPMKDERFLNNSMLAVFEGNPRIELTLRRTVDDPAYEPLRQAVEDFTGRDNIQAILQKLIEGNFARLFVEARSQVNPTVLRAYNKLPERLVGAFKTCATCVGGGTGGALVSHVGCIAIPLFAGAGGTVLSASMNAFMLVSSPLIAAAVTAGYSKWRGQEQSIPRIAGSAAIAFAVAMGVNAMNGHDHHDHDVHHPMTAAELQKILDKEPICSAPRSGVQ